MNERIKQVNNEFLLLKREFADFIKNKDIPLDERWEAFEAADVGLSEQGSFIENFDYIIPGFDDSLYRDHNRGSFRAVDVVMYYDENWNRDKQVDEIDPEEEAKLKEHFLQKNMKSFEFDW